MLYLPKSLQAVIEALGTLPGVGSRTAERYAYHLLKRDPKKTRDLASALEKLHAGVKLCPVTFALINSDEDVSPLYSNNERDKQLIAIVEDPFDVIALESTRQFKGTYHVLGGVISPIDGIGPEALHVPELIRRMKADNVQEAILATNASVEGESTALFLQKQLHDAGVSAKISRLARGLPMGVDLEYADQITLGHALAGRKEVF
jgi:recombination protein RecR